jgi:hypothetical protein
MDWISLIIFLSFVGIVGFLSYVVVNLYFANTKLLGTVGQLIINNKTLSDQLENTSSDNAIENSDGFLKFVSESRDWAFSYIESVQEELNKFVEIVGPVMEYYDKTGRVTNSVHTPSMDKIFGAYNELIKLLPETKNNKENNNE